MKVVWQQGAATVREVCETISRTKPTAYTTILTLMGILEDKGALKHVRSGRAYVYEPLLSCRQATHNHVKDLVDRFFDGQPMKLIENVLDNEFADAEQTGEARRLLQSRNEFRVA